MKPGFWFFRGIDGVSRAVNFFSQYYFKGIHMNQIDFYATLTNLGFRIYSQNRTETHWMYVEMKDFPTSLSISLRLEQKEIDVELYRYDFDDLLKVRRCEYFIKDIPLSQFDMLELLQKETIRETFPSLAVQCGAYQNHKSTRFHAG